MDPGPSRQDGSSPKQQAWPSALGDALEVPALAVSMEVDPSPDEIPSAGELPLAIYQPHFVPSPALNEVVTTVGVGGASSSSMPPAGGRQDLAMVVADDTSRIQTVEAANDRFVPISDVKAMLQTRRFEGLQVVYKNKRTKQNLLHGIIHGTTYFCSCGDDCDHNGKALSARAFALHAVKNSKETHNPNDHIVLSTSNITLFEACRRLKEAKNEAVQEAIFDSIMKGGHGIFPEQNVAPVVKMSLDDNSNLTGLVRNLEERMESTEKRMENLQSQVNTIEKNIDFFCKEMVRYQSLFQDVSKILGKFVDDV